MAMHGVLFKKKNVSKDLKTSQSLYEVWILREKIKEKVMEKGVAKRVRGGETKLDDKHNSQVIGSLCFVLSCFCILLPFFGGF